MDEKDPPNSDQKESPVKDPVTIQTETTGDPATDSIHDTPGQNTDDNNTPGQNTDNNTPGQNTEDNNTLSQTTDNTGQQANTTNGSVPPTTGVVAAGQSNRTALPPVLPSYEGSARHTVVARYIPEPVTRPEPLHGGDEEEGEFWGVPPPPGAPPGYFTEEELALMRGDGQVDLSRFLQDFGGGDEEELDQARGALSCKNHKKMFAVLLALLVLLIVGIVTATTVQAHFKNTEEDKDKDKGNSTTLAP